MRKEEEDGSGGEEGKRRGVGEKRRRGARDVFLL